MYDNSAINLANKRFTWKELDKAFDDIITGRIKLDVSLNGPNFLTAADKKSEYMKYNHTTSKPILDDVLELPDAPNTLPESSFFSLQAENHGSK